MNLSLFPILAFLAASVDPGAGSFAVSNSTETNAEFQLYRELFPTDSRPDFEVFHCAVSGFQSLQDSAHLFKKQVLTLVDFSKPSTVNRLWVIDLEAKRVLFNTLVAHGRNSGELVPSRFSNKPNSLQSSLGFYVTGSTYIGKHGLSLLLDGLENDINDQVKSRAIVVHGAEYVSEKYVKSAGRLGRSQGCPAIPMSIHKELIKEIKDQTCIFIYSPDKEYLRSTKLLPNSKQQLLASQRSDSSHSF